MRSHPDELRADFQQYYGLNIDRMCADYSPEHAAALLAQLPPGSRTYRSERPELAWGYTEALLASIEYSLRVLRWQNTKDGQRDHNPPKPIDPPGGGEKASKIRRTNWRFVDKVLGGARNG